MKAFRIILLIMITLLLAVACKQEVKEPEESQTPGYTNPLMVRVFGQTVTESIGTGAFANATVSNVDVTSVYEISKYEVTKELWYTVYSWATDEARGANKYTFAVNTYTQPATDAEKTMPVGGVNWREALIWCNAYTEYTNAVHGTNLKCVYYSDAALTQPIRIDDGTASNTSTINTAAGSIDQPYVNENADGYRLPTIVEWEYAARGGKPRAAEWSLAYSGSDTVSDVAWTSSTSGGAPHAVGLKAANRLGLYDMSGNLYEWCFDWRVENSTRYVKGGSYDKKDGASSTSNVGGFNNPGLVNAARGFRVVRTIT